jgi:VDE lipocalin domain
LSFLHAGLHPSADEHDLDLVPSRNSHNLPLVLRKMAVHAAAAGLLASTLFFSGALAAHAENELSAKYGGGLDTSLVDQTCLVDRCGAQAKACLADDPSCRKGLTCTAKCLGDNSCITGCMARYGNANLDHLLKCTIEDHECIKVAILDGGSDKFGQEPRSPAPTIPNFDPSSLRGSWYKVVGFNPNYDCYACQRNSFAKPVGNAVAMDVEFSMPHLLPDGSPPPPTSMRELIRTSYDDDQKSTTTVGSQSIGLNDYSTRETMIFDSYAPSNSRLVLHKGSDQEVSYARTAHSEGEMFGLSTCTHRWST